MNGHVASTPSRQPRQVEIQFLRWLQTSVARLDLVADAHAPPAPLIVAFPLLVATPGVLGFDELFEHASLLFAVVVVNIVGPVSAVAFDASWIELTTASVAALDLCSLAQFPSAFRTWAAAAALLADQALGDARLTLAVVIVYVVRVISAVSTNFTGVEPAPRAIVGFDLVAFTQAAAAARRARPRAVLLADQALGDARLPLSVVVPMGPSTGETPPSIRDAVSARNVVGIVSAVPINLARVELAPAAIIRLDLVAFA